jgi:hypothetical protein
VSAIGIGDYGLVSDGVLVKIGNIRHLGIGWTVKDGPPGHDQFCLRWL